MRAEQYLEVLRAHAPELRIDAVVADPAAVEDVSALAARSADLGARLCCARSAGATAPRGTTRCGSRARTRTCSTAFSGTSAPGENPPE